MPGIQARARDQAPAPRHARGLPRQLRVRDDARGLHDRRLPAERGRRDRAGTEPDQSAGRIREAVRACRGHVLLSHFGAWNFTERDGTVEQQPAPSVGGPINYREFLGELERAGYEGYLVGEYCLPCVRDHRIAGIEEIDKAMVQSLTYMRSVQRVQEVHEVQGVH